MATTVQPGPDSRQAAPPWLRVRPPLASFRRRIRSRRAFTLIELLVVIGIMGLLLGITVTAFEGIGKGAKMRAAVTDLKGALSLARQTAISHRRLAYLIFTDSQTKLSDVETNPEVFPPSVPLNLGISVCRTRYQSYMITTRWHTNIVDGAGNDRWVPRPGNFGSWRHLPKGIIFDRDREPDARVVINYTQYANVFSRLTGDNTHGIAFPFDFGEDSYITQACVAIAFHPNGRLVDGSPGDGDFRTPVVFITEGFIDFDDTTGEVTDYFKYDNATTYSLSIRPLTGRIKVVELTE